MTAPASPPPSRRARLSPFLLLVPALLLVVTVVVRGLSGSHPPTEAQVHQDFARILDALERYRAEKGRVPEEGSLEFLVPDYLPELPRDPWGRPYVYGTDGAGPVVSTWGRDDERGGRGEDEDHNTRDGHTR